MNRIREENLRLRTRMQQMEKERESEDGKMHAAKSPSSPNLVTSLKASIKSLKSELSTKDAELSLLKKNLKSTKVAELEIESQAYIDECTRLRHRLAEVMTASRAGLVETLEDKMKEAEKTVEVKDKEIGELRSALQAAQAELQKWRERMVSPRKRSKRKTEGQSKPESVHKQRQPVDAKRKSMQKAGEGKRKEDTDKSMKGKTETEREVEKQGRDLHSVQGKPSLIQLPDNPSPVDPSTDLLNSFFLTLSRFLLERKLSLATLLSYIYRNDSSLCSVADMSSGLQSQGLDARMEDIELLAKACGLGGKIASDRLQAAFRRFEASRAALTGESENSTARVEQPRSPDSVNLKLPPPVEKRKEVTPPAPPEVAKVTLQQVKPLLRHFGYRLQLQRLAKSKLFLVVLGPAVEAETEITLEEMLEHLKKPPMAFTDSEEAMILARFLMEPEAPPITIRESDIKGLKVPAKDIISRLSIHLPDWPVFTSDLESRFDQQISTAFLRNKIAIKESCKSYDTTDSGFITLTEFVEVLENLEIELEQDVMHYMALLFYSHKQELDQVPYREFLSAYTEDHIDHSKRGDSEPVHKRIDTVPDESEVADDHSAEEELSESERAKIVRFYLEKIANYLKERDMRPVELFDIEDGYIYPEGLIKGMRRVPEVDMDQKDAIVFLEGLQAEEMDELCIAREYLEQLLAHYGVPLGRSPRGTIAQELITHTQDQLAHEKRVSLLDGEAAYCLPSSEDPTPISAMFSHEELSKVLSKFAVRIRNLLKMQGKTLKEWLGDKDSVSLFEFLASCQEIAQGSAEIVEIERLFKSIQKDGRLYTADLESALPKDSSDHESSSEDYEPDYMSENSHQVTKTQGSSSGSNSSPRPHF